MEAAAATFGDAEATAVLERSRAQLARTAAVLASTQSPKSTQADGTWTTVSSTDRVGWTQGFFPGAMWLLYEDGGDPAWRSRADQWTRALEGQKERARLTAVFDDAVAVWVNGQIVFSRNMGNGTSYAVYASGGSGDNALATADVAVAPFVSGENVVAAMVKQVSGSSSDLSFDLGLTLTVQP